MSDWVEANDIYGLNLNWAYCVESGLFINCVENANPKLEYQINFGSDWQVW